MTRRHWTDNPNLKTPIFSTVIDARGPNGNIFAILGQAVVNIRGLGLPSSHADMLRAAVLAAPDYVAAVALVERYFPVVR